MRSGNDGADAAEAVDVNRASTDADTLPVSGRATAPCSAERPSERAGTHVVSLYFTCDPGTPGQMYAVHRRVAENGDMVAAALAELLRGPTVEERALGFRSQFSESTAGMLHGVTRSASGDTLLIDFADFRTAFAESANPTSFVAGGVMADITWTLFQSFDDVQALRFAFDGSERAFWSWLAGRDTEPEVFTRRDWEQI